MANPHTNLQAILVQLGKFERQSTGLAQECGRLRILIRRASELERIILNETLRRGLELLETYKRRSNTLADEILRVDTLATRAP